MELLSRVNSIHPTFMERGMKVIVETGRGCFRKKGLLRSREKKRDGLSRGKESFLKGNWPIAKAHYGKKKMLRGSVDGLWRSREEGSLPESGAIALGW